MGYENIPGTFHGRKGSHDMVARNKVRVPFRDTLYIELLRRHNTRCKEGARLLHLVTLPYLF